MILSVAIVTAYARKKDKEEEGSSNEKPSVITAVQLDSAKISAQNAEKKLSEKKQERLLLDYEVTSKSTSASGN